MDRPTTIAEHASALRAGSASVRELTRATLDAIDRADPIRPSLDQPAPPTHTHLNACTQVFADEALDRADRLDEILTEARRSGTPLPPLFAVPIAAKDNICTTLGRTTCASRMLAGYASPFNATAIDRLLDAGAIVIAKTNMDEFGMGSSGEHSCFGVTRNPWDHQRVCGGSSSGSAAIVGAGVLPAALGSDTGGSVREPAAFTGIVGLKPTYARISRWGLIAYASSLDQIGPMARTVRDAAMLLDAMAGIDPLDSTSADRPVLPSADAVDTIHDADDAPLRATTIGVLRNARGASPKPCMDAAIERTASALRDAGAEMVDIELPELEHAIATYYIIATAEASSNLARYDGVRYGRRAAGVGTLDELYERSRTEGFGDEVRRRILLGTYVLSAGYYDAYYLRALKARRLMRDAFANAFKSVSAILMPATPDPPFRIAEKDADPMSLYLEDYYTVTANLAGVPAVALPVMTIEEDGTTLPIGVQLLGRWFDEPVLLRIARAAERGLGFRPLARVVGG